MQRKAQRELGLGEIGAGDWRNEWWWNIFIYNHTQQISNKGLPL